MLKTATTYHYHITQNFHNKPTPQFGDIYSGFTYHSIRRLNLLGLPHASLRPSCKAKRAGPPPEPPALGASK